jgi:hypothetical protein
MPSVTRISDSSNPLVKNAPAACARWCGTWTVRDLDEFARPLVARELLLDRAPLRRE